MANLKTSGYAEVNGINMYYELHGSGNIPLVLIHGGGSTIEVTFGNVLPYFAANNKVIAVELQAHGRTSDRNSPESFEQDADDVAALLKDLNITKANILGFSNGGTTTLQIAIRYPQLVNKIVVIAGSYKRDGFIDGFFDFMPKATIDNMPQPLKDAFLKVTPNEAGLLNMFNKDKQRMIDFKDISDTDISNIKASAMFIVADKDVITVPHTMAMAKLVNGADLIVLPGAHGEALGETTTYKTGSKAPQATAIFVQEFLDK
ncbi:alpha/beta hydrolase [Mucilaginibacter sp.]|uniref:alpha/beta fold hydrolase n=1 Tax=Mucilaginibacter sp. TaxID=1882438 RepID=UPI00261E7976|nr:alpha/beta hydrolase [Mucilaginibacter sp.]MDB4926928.1 Pimeloyl-ACP methyl ester carboxylesterase [Mucilaginibacter sp.]